LKILKRDGSVEEFDFDKIRTAVTKAYNSCGKEVNETVLSLIHSELKIDKYYVEPVSVETIQDVVERIIGRYDFDVAKDYILYREKHKQARLMAEKNIEFINNYMGSDNTANATIDDNANVSNHNISVMNAEIHKEINQITNYQILERKLKKLFPDFDYKQFSEDMKTVCYLHDSSSKIGMPYCVAITMYPFLNDGLKNIGGLSASPKNIDSFCGMFINLIFAIASQFKGAVATPSLFLCMDWFLRKEWGDDYYKNLDYIISPSISNRKTTILYQIHQYFQQICYSLMQPSGGRNGQSVFWNCSVFDKPFYETMYGDFYFPDGTQPTWESFNWLQKDFVHWLNEERLKTILTFPVVSVCLIYQDGKFLDEDLYHFVCKEYSEGNSFFTYISDSADSLSSCCRLSSKLEKPQFNFTNGQLSEMTGSKNVITLDVNRIVQDWCKQDNIHGNDWKIEENKKKFEDYLGTILERVYKYQTAYNACLEELKEAKMLQVYDAGFISMRKQYLTTGINGVNQAAEFLGMKCNKNEDYKEFCRLLFSTIKKQNQLHKTKDLMFNTEFTPCESAAIKLYNRDKNDGYWVPDDTNLYASYIFKPNDTEISILDKIYLHGRDFCGEDLDGGSACHLSLEDYLTERQYEQVLKYAAEVGCKYFCFNCPQAQCEDCGFIAKRPFETCPKCGSKNISLWDRIIGYLTKIKNWSKGRQIEQKTRVYMNIGKEEKLC
jgi:ribonucleoside-triphosphate reductase